MTPEAQDWYSSYDMLLARQASTQAGLKKEESALADSGIRRLLLTCRDLIRNENSMPVNLFGRDLPEHFRVAIRDWFGLGASVNFIIKYTSNGLRERVDLQFMSDNAQGCEISFEDDSYRQEMVSIELRSHHRETRVVREGEIHETSGRVRWETVPTLEIIRGVNNLADRYLEQVAEPEPSTVAPA